MEDSILRTISRDGTIRAVIATTTNTVECARKRHNLSFTATAALGRALTAGIFRFSSSVETRTVSRAIVDSLPFGAVVSDRDGKISYDEMLAIVEAIYKMVPRAASD